jgi:hypothetical protein
MMSSVYSALADPFRERAAFRLWRHIAALRHGGGESGRNEIADPKVGVQIDNKFA